jgi:hypothetical protein
MGFPIATMTDEHSPSLQPRRELVLTYLCNFQDVPQLHVQEYSSLLPGRLLSEDLVASRRSDFRFILRAEISVGQYAILDGPGAFNCSL